MNTAMDEVILEFVRNCSYVKSSVENPMEDERGSLY